MIMLINATAVYRARKSIQSKNHYQHSLEQPALSDVKAAILGQNFNVLDFIVEPVEDE